MRLLVRPDLDGLTCAVFLQRLEPIDEVVFVEPHPLQTGQVEVRPDDIIANLPYHPGCGMWFDHHVSNAPPPGLQFKGAFRVDPSAARTIYDYYQDARLEPFQELLDATDRVDAALLTLDDVLNPRGYVLLALTLDPRSNLNVSDAYYHQLIEWLGTESAEAILEKPEVKSRLAYILGEQQRFEDAMRTHSRREGLVVVTDLRDVWPQPVGSRFLVYALFSDCNASLKLYPARSGRGETGISLGHSIFNRTQQVNVGKVCARYGGGGHFGAASCVVPSGDADQIALEMLQVLQANQPV